MPLRAGARLGPYEILSPIGAGGMGEVYRARDTRLERDVAVKVLPAGFASDPDRLRRFEQEARAAGVLNHPGILAIHDIGTHEGVPYVVSELLEGETLRERMGGAALPQRKAIEYARQIASGLAAAHEKGIVHRDLKPENLFVTNDGRVKILDFGLAKLTQPEASASDQTGAPTRASPTEPGAVMGTVGYMSPEQVRGKRADHRADIFAFGAILYEMLSGRRAFRGESAVEAMSAILKEEPPDLSETNRTIPPALERIVRHCLEKNPEERFQSARDLAFDLDALSGLSGTVAASPGVPSGFPRHRIVGVAAAVVLIGAALAGLFLAGRRAGIVEGLNSATAPAPSYHQIAFRRGIVNKARFAPDGRTIVYSAAWDGNPFEIYSARPESPESRALGIQKATILAISPSGEMALGLGGTPESPGGTLARAPLAGGAPRETLEHVAEADWAPNGTDLAVVRFVEGRQRLEYPIGKTLYETSGWVENPRISLKGDLVAFLDHASLDADDASVAVVDLSGKKTTLSPVWNSTTGLAWSPSGDEVWFTATRSGTNCSLRAVTLEGKERLVARVPGRLTLHDVSRDGRVLLAHENFRMRIVLLPPGEKAERDLSWFDRSIVQDVSADGRTILFSEHGEAGGETYAVYLRRADGSPAVRLGDGQAVALSPDGKWALSLLYTSPQQLVLLPAGAGEQKRLIRGSVETYHAGTWLPDGKRILFAANEAGRPVRLYVQDVEGGDPRAVTAEGVSLPGHTVSPDGRLVAALGSDGVAVFYPLQGGEPRPIPGLATGEIPIRWSADGRSLFVRGPSSEPARARIDLLDVETGGRAPWREIAVADPAGVERIYSILPAPDGKSCAYTYIRILSDLYLVEGLK